MNPALLQKGSNSFRTDSEIKDHEGSIQLREWTWFQMVNFHKQRAITTESMV